MAETSSSSPPLTPDMIDLNLSRLLSRLDKKIPQISVTDQQSKPAPGTLPGVVERRKIAANLEYARQLLLHLETEYATVKNNVERKRVVEDLVKRKATIRKLNERLHGIEELEEIWEENEEGGKKAEKIGAKAVAKVQVTNHTTAHNEQVTGGVEARKSSETTYTLRNRLARNPTSSPTPTPATAIATATSTSTSTKTPVPPLTTTKTTLPPKNTQGLEAQLSSHHHEQASLTEDLLSMTRALKESSLLFNKALEDEKPYLDMAAQGLDRNITGMQTMGGRMDKLRKDGRVGWYRTIINIVTIVVLGIVGLIILMLPKLRR